jgi:hypothetical protein
MPATPESNTNPKSPRNLRHREYYFEGADLIIRVRMFMIEHRVVP